MEPTPPLWFAGWESLERIIVTGVVCFIGLIILLRLGGKRTLTKMNAFDFIMTFTIGSTLATTITSQDVSITEGMTALAVIIAVQFVIAWLEVRSDWFQALVKSQPSVLFQHGKFQYDVMRRERITEVEVLAAMRYSGLADPSQAELVIMETDGQLSVIPSQKQNDEYGALKPVAYHPRKQANR